MTKPSIARETVTIAGVELELHEGGEGAPLLFIHSGQGFAPNHPYVPLLAAKRRLIAPSHPGFGRSSLPDWLDSVDDIAHLYLELMDKRGLDRVDMVGASIGGWIAAEIATKVPERLRKVVLVGPAGVKVGPPDRLDIPDMFAMSQESLSRLLFHDPAKAQVNYPQMSEEDVSIMVRNRETLALLTWEPYMHNPKLKHRLHRVTVPTLFVRGASDGLISAEYMDQYARLLPNAKTATIPNAGHAPQIEQPEAFARTVLEFLDA
jgi:pimeloyl-ACP methyl ester carboxylesterase